MLRDLSAQGKPVNIQARSNRWRCRNRQCDRQIFAERLPKLATPFARRTTRLAGIVKLFGHGAGGRPSERLMASLGMPVSDTTILRVRPNSSLTITELSQHEANGGELQESQCVSRPIFPVLGQATASVEPGESALDHPPAWQDNEPLRRVRSLDDLHLELGHDASDPGLEHRTLVAGVGEDLAQERVEAEQGGEQQDAAVAVLNIRRVDDSLQQQTFGVDQDMALLAVDPLSGIVSVRVDLAPPFSALLTLWLSMMQAVGLASRSSLSRHWT